MNGSFMETMKPAFRYLVCHRIDMQLLKFLIYTFYTPEVKLRTYYGMASVLLSVRPSVSHIMSAQYLEKFMSDSRGTW